MGAIKSMYVDSLPCVRIKGGESEQFMIDCGVRQGFMSPLAFQCIYGCSDERGGDVKEGSEWRLCGLLYADDLVLYGES